MQLSHLLPEGYCWRVLIALAGAPKCAAVTPYALPEGCCPRVLIALLGATFASFALPEGRHKVFVFSFLVGSVWNFLGRLLRKCFSNVLEMSGGSYCAKTICTGPEIQNPNPETLFLQNIPKCFMENAGYRPSGAIKSFSKFQILLVGMRRTICFIMVLALARSTTPSNGYGRECKESFVP